MSIRRALLLAVTSMQVLAHAPPAAAQGMELFYGNKPKPFIEPAGFYAVILPNGFDCEARPRHVECKGNRGAQALLTIDVVDVPPSATADIAMLNQMDRFKKKPHFKQIAQGRTAIDGSPAITSSFSYDYMGNVEYAVAVQQLIMVRGGKLYLIHLETRLDHFAAYGKDLAQLYGSFKPARVDAGGNPMVEDLKPAGLDDAAAAPDISQALKGRY